MLFRKNKKTINNDAVEPINNSFPNTMNDSAANTNIETKNDNIDKIINENGKGISIENEIIHDQIDENKKSGRKLFQKGNKEYMKREGFTSRTHDVPPETKKEIKDVEVEDNILNETINNDSNFVVTNGRKLFKKGNTAYKKRYVHPTTKLSNNKNKSNLDNESDNEELRSNLFQIGNTEYKKKGRKERGQENRVDTHAARGKEIIINTRARDRARKRREEQRRLEREKLEQERKAQELIERRKAFVELAKKKAQKNNELVEKLQQKGKEEKVASNGEKEARERIQRAMKMPFSYYFNGAFDNDKKLKYVNVNQCMNDKFAGRIFQPQYFGIAEQSDRIFEINGLMITQAVGQAKLREDVTFLVQVSAKWFEKSSSFDELCELLRPAPDNLMIAIDAQTLASTGKPGSDRLTTLLSLTQVKIVLDNPEEEKISLVVDYPISAIRLDKRYYADKSTNKIAILKILVSFCKDRKIDVFVKYVDDIEFAKWFYKLGIFILEGSAIQSLKENVKNAAGPKPGEIKKVSVSTK